jgi:PAS domain S-box-containing protein
VAQLGYWEIDTATGHVFWSDEMYRFCGMEPNDQPPPTDRYLDCVHPEDRPRMQAVAERALSDAREFVEQYRLRGPDGKLKTVQAKGRVIVDADGRRRLIGTVQDITDRVRLESHLRQSQKMEAVGNLAGGIAHDFNNALTIIMSYADMAASSLPEGAPLRQDLNEISNAATHAAMLTRQLLTFSRQQVVQPQRVSVNQVVAGIERMLRRLLPANIALETRLDADVPPIWADPGQLEQVIVNLAVNARDAMPDGGTLTIETAAVILDDSTPPLSHGTRGGRFLMLAVTDTGTGMDESVRSRIFEPFFTTKEKGKGTGIGLATVYGIVHQSEGHIWVYSEPGHGTAFKIYFPARDTAGAAVAGALPRARVHRGSETILLAEDEPTVRTATRRILEHAGYTVLEAEDGASAVEQFRVHRDDIDLVISDMMMPKMSGRELADRICAIRSDVRLLFISGYTDDTVAGRSMLPAGASFIQKPFTPQSLTEKVREAFTE